MVQSSEEFSKVQEVAPKFPKVKKWLQKEFSSAQISFPASLLAGWSQSSQMSIRRKMSKRWIDFIWRRQPLRMRRIQHQQPVNGALPIC